MNNKNKIKIVILWLVFLGVCIVPIFIWLIKHNLLFAVIIPVILLSIYMLIIKKSNLRKTKGEKIIEKAVEDGTVVMAKRFGKIKSYLADLDSQNVCFRQDRYGAKYEYIVNGHRYVYKCIFRNNVLPDEIELYYPKGKPKKAISDSTEKLFMLIIPAIIVIVVLLLLGVIDIKNIINI